MKTLREWTSRLLGTLRPSRPDADLEAEMRAHLEFEAEAEARRSGVPAAEARRRARVRGGNVTQSMDDVRDQRGWPGLESVLQDVRYAGRLIARQPRFSLIVILTIALAIGLSTALFSVIDATIVRPVNYPHPEQLMEGGVAGTFEGINHPVYSVAISDMRRWRTAPPVAAAAAFSRLRDTVLDGATPRRVNARDVTEGYLGLYGAVPELGRDFAISDTDAAAPLVVIVSHAYWQAALGAEPGVIGRVLRYDNVSAEVIGVAPAGFDASVTIWRPLRGDAAQMDGRGGPTAVVRVRPEFSLKDAVRQLSSVTPIGDRKSAVAGDGSLGGQVRLLPVLDGILSRAGSIVPMLASAVGLIVFIACVNVAGLQLARGTGREAELAVRSSLGAGRRRLLRQLLIESLTLATAGGAVGVLIAWVSLDALLAILPVTLQPGVEAGINSLVLAASVVLTMATGLAFGMAPAMRLSKASVMGRAARGGASQRATLSRRGGQSVIAAEVALAVVLVAGAGLMIRSFARLVSVDLGFDPGAVVAFAASPVDSTPTSQTRYFAELLQNIRALPDVAAAGAVDYFALGDSSVTMGIRVNGVSTAAGIRQVLPGYFEAIGLPLRAGSLPTSADADADRPIAVLNESSARSFFPDGAVGQSIVFSGRTLTVVGVVSDYRMRGPAGDRSAEVFVPFVPPASRGRAVGLTVVVRPRSGAVNLLERLRRLAEHSGTRAIVDEPRPGTAWFDDRVATPRHQTWLIALLALSGLALTLVGIFSTTAYAVARRTREIGVRMALGARPGDVVRQMVGDAGSPMLLGLAGGLAGAFFGTKVLESWLFNTAPRDPVTFAAIGAFTVVCTLAAAWIPARRAARVDPVMALRTE